MSWIFGADPVKEIGTTPSGLSLNTLTKLVELVCSAMLKLVLKLFEDDEDELPVESEEKKGRLWRVVHQRGERGLNTPIMNKFAEFYLYTNIIYFTYALSKNYHAYKTTRLRPLRTKDYLAITAF